MRLHLLRVSALVAGLLSCVSDTEHREPNGVELYVIDGGTTVLPDKALFDPAYAGHGPVRQPVTCFLVRHPRGLLLWDTGHDPRSVTGAIAGKTGYEIRIDVPLEEQLAAVCVQPEDIDYLALSHWHFDHTGGTRLFPGATLLGQADEYEYAFSAEGATGFGMVPETYATLRDNPKDLFLGDRDVFGDGTVRILRASGHTRGSQVLVVRLSERTVVLSGDLYHFSEQRTHHRVPSFNHDREATLESMRRVERLLESEPNAELWITHDPVQMAGLRYAPEVYL